MSAAAPFLDAAERELRREASDGLVNPNAYVEALVHIKIARYELTGSSMMSTTAPRENGATT